MRSITIQVPDDAEQPRTIADYAFAQTFENKYGTLQDFLKNVQESAMTQLNEYLRDLSLYLNITSDNDEEDVGHRLIDVTKYFESMIADEGAGFDPRDVTWTQYIHDCRSW